MRKINVLIGSLLVIINILLLIITVQLLKSEFHLSANIFYLTNDTMQNGVVTQDLTINTALHIVLNLILINIVLLSFSVFFSKERNYLLYFSINTGLLISIVIFLRSILFRTFEIMLLANLFALPTEGKSPGTYFTGNINTSNFIEQSLYLSIFAVLSFLILIFTWYFYNGNFFRNYSSESDDIYQNLPLYIYKNSLNIFQFLLWLQIFVMLPSFLEILSDLNLIGKDFGIIFVYSSIILLILLALNHVKIFLKDIKLLTKKFDIKLNKKTLEIFSTIIFFAISTVFYFMLNNINFWLNVNDKTLILDFIDPTTLISNILFLLIFVVFYIIFESEIHNVIGLKPLKKTNFIQLSLSLGLILMVLISNFAVINYYNNHPIYNEEELEFGGFINSYTIETSGVSAEIIIKDNMFIPPAEEVYFDLNTVFVLQSSSQENSYDIVLKINITRLDVDGQEISMEDGVFFFTCNNGSIIDIESSETFNISENQYLGLGKIEFDREYEIISLVEKDVLKI